MANNLEQQNQKNLQPRPPVVVILGHVDHGKSSLLEAIKDLKITAKESGGITQHIGAYEVEHKGKSITFIDTPGHEAFSAMRSRGAKVADIAILVVAAEESVKPQTKEAILHIKKAGLPLIVAINKIDKPEANPEKVKRDLAQLEISVESLGGSVPAVGVSAKTGKGIEDLLELIILVAEIQNFQGDQEGPGEGVVIESYLDSKRGPTATLLLREGVLRVGDIIATRSVFGKLKMLENFQGDGVEKATPSMPVVVMGLGAVPQVGETFEVYEDMESAQKYVAQKERKEEAGEVFVIEEGKKALNIILKTDVRGSAEAIAEGLKELPQEKVILRLLKSDVGDISETDVKLAKSGKAKIIGFRVKTAPTALVFAEREEIAIKAFEIIYELIQEVRQMMEKVLEPEKVRTEVGRMKAIAIFLSEKNRQIIGGKIVSGEVRKGVQVDVFRGEEFMGRGRIINVQKNKKDAERALRGDECGVLFEGDIKAEDGDILHFFTEEKRKGTL
ncbi:MAG: translation initiation factor IF-2 [Candidatus Nealsonbacteria bacterium]|nr:translation initiation factor IF-2 [Candidatus Nealsonbacteria bacterium]